MTGTVSVITPTWQRHGLLTSRAMPSVQAQTYSEVEHIVVSDGPDPALADVMAGYGLCRFPVIWDCLPVHDGRVKWGVRARWRAAQIATGDLLCYLDDDNSFRPEHIAKLAARFTDPAIQFAYSIAQVHRDGQPAHRVGKAPPAYTQIDTSTLMCRRSALAVADWRPGQNTIDWDLAERWLASGLPWAFVPEVTVDYYK